MKLPNDLVKSTDYENAKDREIHEFEHKNGKYIQHYVLGGEHCIYKILKRPPQSWCYVEVNNESI